MFFFEDSLYASDLTDVWDVIPLIDKTALSINVGTRVITPQEQFEDFFDGRRFKLDDTQKIERQFLTIYGKNKWLIEKIKKETEIIKGLLDLENWNDVSKSEIDNTVKGDTKTKSEGKVLGNSGNTDNNSYVDEDVLNGFMTFDSNDNRKIIPANFLTQNINKDKRDDSVDMKNKTTGSTTVTTSNNSTDLISLHNLNLTDLRGSFWGKFNSLFI